MTMGTRFHRVAHAPESSTSTAGFEDHPAILITGASSGIGHAIALHLDNQGFRVFAGVRNLDDALSLAAAASGRLTPVMIDVTDQDSIAHAARFVAEETGGGLQGLVNNAGVALFGPLEGLSGEQIEHQFAVNTIAPVAVSRAFLPLLRAGQGRVINIGSPAAHLLIPYFSAYCASKAALASFTDALRLELRPWNIPVVLIEPPSVASALWGQLTLPEGIVYLEPEVARTYREVGDRLLAAFVEAGRRGGPPDQVVRTVEKALIVSRPRQRYVVGATTHLSNAIERVLPNAIRDALLYRAMRLPTKPAPEA